MIQIRTIATLCVLGSLAALPGCGMNGHGGGNQYSSAAPARPAELSPETVKQVQTTLTQQHDYSGAIDGIWGPATESALRSYQQANALPASGQLDPATIASLRAVRMSAADPAAPMPAPAQAANNALPPIPAAASAPASAAPSTP